jgi:stage III sporulation protein AG
LPAPISQAAVVAEASADLEAKLNSLLAGVKGAGTVAVAVNYSESAETVYVFDQEQSGQDDSEGNTSSEKTTLAAISETPVVAKQLQPKVQGITVVSSGADDPQVKERLYQAVRGLTGLDATQIAIIEGEGSNNHEISMEEK